MANIINLPILGFAGLALLFYLILSWVATKIHNAKEARRLGCGSVPIIPREKWWDYFRVFNLKQIIENSRAGTFPIFAFKRYQRISELAGRDCPTFRNEILGRPVVFTAEPRNVQAVLATQFKDFQLGTLRQNAFDPLLGHGIFTSNGHAWEHSRGLLRPSFSRDQISDLDLEEKHCQNLMKALAVGSDGWTTAPDIQPLFFRLTIDSSTEFLFGASVESQLKEIGEFDAEIQNESMFATEFDRAQHWLAMRGRYGSQYWLVNPAEFRRACKVCHEFIDRYVQRTLKDQQSPSQVEKGEKKYVFLNELAKQIRDPIEIRSQLLHILLAGRDTTASLLSWTFLMLARHPNIYAKLRKTVIEEFGEYKANDRGNITFSKLKSCQYLQQVLSESLRLFPVVPFNNRQAIRDTTLPTGGGPDGTDPVFIPKGTDVAYSVYIMHRRKAIWGSDAEEFNPDRWQGRRPGWEFLPFNGGPRICLGQQFALTSAGYATVRLLQKFDSIENTDGFAVDDVLYNASLTMTSGRGVKLRLHEAKA